MVGKLVATLDQVGHYTQQPQTWAGTAVALAVGGGRKGRRAALRGSACYAITSVITNLLIKPLVDRSRPSGAHEGGLGPLTSSFPSGHAASDLAFTFGAAQELPALFFPLAAATFPAHWSLVRSHGHHVSDVVFGGVVGIVVAWVVWRRWPVAHGDEDRTGRPSGKRSSDDRPRAGVS
ncbi:MAG: phosphatase PAP2 family protein [Actinomycetota bacterium]|nr:phosphatase PAP2 family protein [Actinomycetota bacterium]